MVEKSILLEAAGGRLRLEPDENAWCRVTLEVAEDRDVELGADSLSTVRMRLLNALGPLRGLVSGEIDGRAVYHVLSLFERHCTLYAADAPEGRRLFIQDAGGKVLGAITIPNDRRRAWASALSAK